MRRPKLGLHRIGGLRPSESAATPGFYYFTLADHSILPGKQAGLLWVRRWTWYGLLEHQGRGGGRTRRWAALDPCPDGEVVRQGVLPCELLCPALWGAVWLFGTCVCRTY